MNKSPVLLGALAVLLLGVDGPFRTMSVASTPSTSQQTVSASGTETLVLIRHGEKTAQEFGQLSSIGLKRSLALPDILIGKYGKPDFLFAPNPSAQIHSRADSQEYSYVRPLATIEPTAITLGMPVNTQFGFTDIEHLQTELTQPKYAGAVVFVAWEHGYLDKFAKEIVKANGGDAGAVPSWPGKDYDSIFVIRLQHSGAKTTVSFTLDHEGLNDKLADRSSPVQAGSR